MQKRLNRLGIISDCLHVMLPGDNAATANYSLLRQFESLAAYFNEVIICCPFTAPQPRVSYSKYTGNNIRFIQSKVAGGNTIRKKIGLLRMIPSWLRMYKQINLASDVIYLRFPNNISIPALFYFTIKGKKMFATYTAPWDNDAYTSASYSIQRWLLKKFFKGLIWVYSNKKVDSAQIKKSFSPTYNFNDWLNESEHVANRMKKLQTEGLQQLRLLSAGMLDKRKNHIYILQTCVQLKQLNIPFILSIAGDGEMREKLEKFIKDNALENCIFLRGYQSHNELRQLFRKHDFVVQAPLSEGYGKVPVEGFYYGLIPIISSATLLAEEMIAQGERGFLFDARKEKALVNILVGIYKNSSPAELQALIKKGREYAKSITLERWAEDYITTLETYFD